MSTNPLGAGRHAARPLIVLAGWGGLASLLLPLYLYPTATFDPIEGGRLYVSPQFLSVYLPYAVLLAGFSLGVLLGRGTALCAWSLFVSFLGLQAHVRLAFGDRIAWKPLFVAAFVLLPAAVLLLGALAALAPRAIGRSNLQETPKAS